MQEDTQNIEIEDDNVLIAFKEEFQYWAESIILSSTPNGIVTHLLNTEKGDWIPLSQLVDQTGEATNAFKRLCQLSLGNEFVHKDNLFICWTPDPIEATYAFVHIFSSVAMSHFFATVSRAYFNS